MADAKIEIKVGAVSFSGEGDGKWLSEQLDKIIEKLPELANVAPELPGGSGDGDGKSPATKKAKGTLASFLNAKNVKTNKTRKFLATAVWLHDSSGNNRLATGAVKKALRQNNQGSVGNASQCLVQNVKAGFIAKEGKQFYVTDEGRTQIG